MNAWWSRRARSVSADWNPIVIERDHQLVWAGLAADYNGARQLAEMERVGLTVNNFTLTD